MVFIWCFSTSIFPMFGLFLFACTTSFEISFSNSLFFGSSSLFAIVEYIFVLPISVLCISSSLMSSSQNSISFQSILMNFSRKFMITSFFCKKFMPRIISAFESGSIRKVSVYNIFRSFFIENCIFV